MAHDNDDRLTLDDLEVHHDFIRRHIGPGKPQIKEMLGELGYKSLNELIETAVPPSIRIDDPLDIPPSISERKTLSALRAIADKNKVCTTMIGMGYYGTITPPVILRNVLENPGWYTAYTPYQPEVSQGRLEALLNYQQMVIDLTGMELANASLLDEGTAAAEAMAMAHRVSKSKSDAFFVDNDVHPQTLAVIRTRAWSLGIEVIEGDSDTDLDEADVFGALIQYPGSSGRIRDISEPIRKVQEKGGLAIVASDLMALVMLKPPGEYGADVVVGSAQRFGVPMGYGGPHAAFFATREAHKRNTPGRIIGVSVDAEGRKALRMALQTREQHIRREKATSNICTAQVLLAVIAGFYAVYHGPHGLYRIARRIHRKAQIVAEALRRRGYEIVHSKFFDTIQVRQPGQAPRLLAKAKAAGINLRLVDSDTLGISLDEATKRQDLDRLLAVFSSNKDEPLSIGALDREVADDVIPHILRRTPDEYLTHPIFNLYHGETEMLRYIRWLCAKDIALDRSMIPLGSCTMKLNATTEMIPVTWRNFAHLHPFAPLDQAQGYQQMFEDLETWLCEITGYDAISLMPNAGSQGEYAGLLTIRRYHESRGDTQRDICLIPSSAHGTNPASAIMAGMKVVVVKCDEAGNIDMADLKEKAEKHTDNLAAIMITYPSTHGVFEETVEDICALVHEHGGQVYVDGANLNAMVGICKPGKFGADVSHLNLHKTFCIPHGGGGPGMGPIGVRRHLAPFLSEHPMVDGLNPYAHEDKGHVGPVGPVSAAPWGSASILPIVWAYIRMMGPQGLRQATEVAILNANYIAHRLKDHYPILYTGRNGTVAHECIVDCRAFKETCGVSVEDIAKRLVDFGFHAPTMSWPVPETMMIEPTESEAKRELDRFCDAMIRIREEIREVEEGKADRENNVLVNAPHTHHLLMETPWPKPYTKEAAFFPLPSTRDDKYWPPVARVDNVAGDRNLVCTCPPMDAYAEAAE
ncbi:MAG: aminomethyl-transferring glycine dehydrogenase [Alphaproteobacteria bacterium]|nr:aminomethyl-transferring glycine dehydrogenase [Alphaproteobacteria bacterium]